MYPSPVCVSIYLSVICLCIYLPICHLCIYLPIICLPITYLDLLITYLSIVYHLPIIYHPSINLCLSLSLSMSFPSPSLPLSVSLSLPPSLHIHPAAPLLGIPNHDGSLGPETNLLPGHCTTRVITQGNLTFKKFLAFIYIHSRSNSLSTYSL